MSQSNKKRVTLKNKYIDLFDHLKMLKDSQIQPIIPKRLTDQNTKIIKGGMTEKALEIAGVGENVTSRSKKAN